MESATLGLITIVILIKFLVCRITRGGNCLLVPHTSYATVYRAVLIVIYVCTE